MRNYAEELKNRVAFIQNILQDAHAKGIVYGNSGGKDCTLVGILCKKACENVLSVAMPCQSTRNFGEDMQDALATVNQFGIENIVVDLSDTKASIVAAIEPHQALDKSSLANIAPRLRMTTLYAIGQARGYLVAGTGNQCERYMGYFTKWGDGACDFNPIADLAVSEIYEFLEFLGAPRNIIEKAPSAGLFEGQTDENEMGVTYAEIEQVIREGSCGCDHDEKIARAYRISAHKRRLPPCYGDDKQ